LAKFNTWIKSDEILFIVFIFLILSWFFGVITIIFAIAFWLFEVIRNVGKDIQ